jgi:hypothetical protein
MKTRVHPVMGAIVWTLMLAGVPAAQSKVPGLPSGTQLNPGSVSPGGSNFIVIGCISREGRDAAETFVITDSRATPPAQYRLQGDTDLLRIHVGHTVEIGGPMTPAPNGRGGASTAAPALKVQSLIYISTTCSQQK